MRCARSAGAVRGVSCLGLAFLCCCWLSGWRSNSEAERWPWAVGAVEGLGWPARTGNGQHGQRATDGGQQHNRTSHFALRTTHARQHSGMGYDTEQVRVASLATLAEQAPVAVVGMRGCPACEEAKKQIAEWVGRRRGRRVAFLDTTALRQGEQGAWFAAMAAAGNEQGRVPFVLLHGRAVGVGVGALGRALRDAEAAGL